LIAEIKKLLISFIRVTSCLKNIAWQNKYPCDVLIYDTEGSDILMHCIPLAAKVNILNVRNGLPMIKSTRFFIALLRNILTCGKVKAALIKSLFDVWKPKVVITFIDNSKGMGTIRRLYPDLPAISVQNGSRWDIVRNDYMRLFFDHYYSFGQVERELLSKGGHIANSIHSIGSLRVGIFKDQKEINIDKYDLCFISEFVPKSDLDKQSSQWARELLTALNELEKALYDIVVNFAEKNNLSLCLALRYSQTNPSYKEELGFFANEKKTKVKIFPRDGFSSYSAVSASRLTVCAYSTLGYEGLGMGRRVMFAADVKSISMKFMEGVTQRNFSTHMLPDLQRIYSISYEEVSVKAMSLLQMKNEDYTEYVARARSYYMNNTDNQPQEIIRKKIQSLLSADITKTYDVIC